MLNTVGYIYCTKEKNQKHNKGKKGKAISIALRLLPLTNRSGVHKVTQVNCADFFSPIVSLPIEKVQVSIYVHTCLNDLKEPLTGSFDRQWKGSLKWRKAKELWNIKAFLKLKILQTVGGKSSKCTWPFIHYLHLKTQQITSTGPENQTGFLVLLTASESDTTVSHQFHHGTSRIFISSG